MPHTITVDLQFINKIQIMEYSILKFLYWITRKVPENDKKYYQCSIMSTGDLQKLHIDSRVEGFSGYITNRIMLNQ